MLKKVLTIAALVGLAVGANAQERKAYIVSNAHFDSQWNWDVQKSISEYIPKTLDQNLMLIDKYPNYIFNFEGGVKYAWMKEYFPIRYEQVKKHIANGRWHVTGSTWDATDPNIPSPESFTRNILYGQMFFEEEFGVRSTDIFLPDCFGFGWTLPTIAAHSGLIGFSTQKLQWRNNNFYPTGKIPFEIGLWQGVDGSRIMMVADAHNYTTKWPDEDLSHNAGLKRITDRSPLKTVYHYYGTGDTGGAPTIGSVRALEKGLAGDGPVKIISATSDQLYKDYLPFSAHPELPVFNDELLMDVHATGCYTSQAAMKLYNRRNELLADAAERSAIAAHWLGANAYPQATLSEAWKRFIWHQFHDDLTGTSIPRAYEFSWNDELISLKQFENVLTTSVGAVSRALDTNVKGTPLVIYNPNGHAVANLVEATVTLPNPSKNITVYAPTGKPVHSQVLHTNGNNVTLLIAATVPATGYAVYDVRTGGAKPASSIAVTPNSIENSVYSVTLDKNGDITSIIDKRVNRQLVAKGRTIRLAMFTENESFNWPAWEILKKEIDKTPESITDEITLSVAEQGSLRASICVERKHGASTFKQYIQLNEGPLKDQIDIVNDIDWQSTNALLKAEFPLTTANPKAVYDLGVGTVSRGNNVPTAYEVYAQQWADLTAPDGSYGVSILNDSKYGWDKPDDATLRLTLLHTPKTRGGYAYQDKQDFGRHQFTYAIYGHKGDHVQGATANQAEMFNQPLFAFVAPKHKGTLGRVFSMGSANGNVALRAFKMAEKSDEYVLRFYETSGKGQQEGEFKFPADIIEAHEINGVEDVLAPANFQGHSLKFSMAPYSIKSFKVRLAASANTLTPAVSTPIDLAFDTKTASYNAYRRDVNFDGKGNSYPAELLPAEIAFKGITFKLGEPDAANGLKCKAQTINLPAGNHNMLYLLAAATRHDTSATLLIDNKPTQVVIPAYGGFIGQWGHTGHTEGFLKPTDVAFVATHKHSILTNADVPYDFAYMFAVAVPLPAKAKTVTLPNDANIVVFAATAALDANNAITPAADILRVNLPAPAVGESAAAARNLLIGKKVVENTGFTNQRETPELAIDDDIETKWCDVSGNKPKYITVDLGKVEEIKGWKVFHAALESLDYITKEYALMVKTSENDAWKTVDAVSDNTAIETDRLLSAPVKARFVRLSITKPDQSEGNAARIYEFAVY